MNTLVERKKIRGLQTRYHSRILVCAHTVAKLLPHTVPLDRVSMRIASIL
jgi:hypothetical protein